jgi:putative PIN family toxin of toxin-antitoxin system
LTLEPTVVFDTNVYISGLLWRGTPYRCLYAARAHLVQAFTCSEILEEIRLKLETKFLFSADKANDTISDISSYCRLVGIPGSLHGAVQDPADDKFVECASVAGARYIVSVDRHLLVLKKYETIEVIQPAALLSILTREH